jgi:hypothetical protein
MRRSSLALWLALLLLSLGVASAQRIPDPGFDTSVERPAYKRAGPAVVIDEAHSNFHTAEGRYVPDGAAVLMKLGPGAKEAQSVQELQAGTGRRVGGRAQGIALKLGKGRVVIVGEAAMFSAQLIRFEHEGKPMEFKMGMNLPGNDDRQLALNIFHWLSGLLE